VNVGLPRLEARVSAQEYLVTMLAARIEELRQDMAVNSRQLIDQQIASERKLEARIDALGQDLNLSFKQLVEYHIETEQNLEAQFNEIKATMATKDDIAALEGRIVTIETNMATKDDIANMATKDELASMEGRILDAFKQLVAVIDARLPGPSLG